MSRRSLRIAVLIGAAIALCQVSRTQVAPGTTGAAVQNGTTVLLGNAPTTPVTTYAAPPPTAGISNAGRAGISNSEPLPATLPGQSDTVVYFSQPGDQPLATTPAMTELGTTTPPVEGAAGGAAAPEAGRRTFNDFVAPSYVAAPGGASSASLGEISAEFKAHKAAGGAHMLTNQDVQQMLGSRTGVTVAKNMRPRERGAMPPGVAAGPETQTAGTQLPSSGNTVAQASSQAGQGGTPATPPGQAGTTGHQAGTPLPVDASQQHPAGTEATAGSSTTPRVNPGKHSNYARGKSKVPARARIRPLLGLLGIVSGAMGLWYRRFHK